MKVSEAIQSRRSVRAYEPKPIPDEVLLKILEAGRLAPSASNRQPWHFIVVKDLEKKKILSAGRYAHFLVDTPVVVVGCGDAELSPRWYVIDVTIALQQMVLMATEEGIGTCWIGSFDEEPVRTCLSIPERYKVVAMLAMGYSKDKLDLSALFARSKNRKALKEITSSEVFGNRY
jgi:nitroreductase